MKNQNSNFVHICIIFFLLSFFFLYIAGCEKDLTPANNNPKINLSVEDVGVTEVWLRLSVQNLNSKNRITITRNDSTIKQFNNLTTDTLIYDTELLPNNEYTYSATSTGSASGSLLSEVEITTMDTTSHDFTWEIFTFGEHSSSALYDVAIIDENNIWAVGEIYITDSIGNDIKYNAIHWDGNEWNLVKITVRLQYNGTVIYTDSDNITNVFAANNNDIWFVSDAGGVTRFKNNNWLYMEIPYGEGPGSTYKIWGLSANELFFVGPNGKITYYNEQTWQRIESSTDLQVYDIFGRYDNSDENYRIYLVAAYQLHSQDKKILEVKNSEVISLPSNPIPSSLHGIWFKPPFHHYVVGSGIYKKSDIYSNKPWQPIHFGVSNYYIYAIRGNDINDIVICGSFGELLHFNGMTWKSYRTLFAMDNGDFKEINIKDNLIIAVGCKNSQAVIVRGTK